MSDTVDPSADVEKETLGDEPRSILMGIIAQLSKGMDLHRVTLPTFVLEPRSMLERITDFMAHPELLIAASKEKDPVQRFVKTVAYYLSGWHIRPKGVKKPYNPVLGEYFRCRWQLDQGDNSEAFYIAEQVSHHPPMSAYYYYNPEHGLSIVGDTRPKSKFLGNSAATIMQGLNRIKMREHPGEEYAVTMPNVYARGILFGTMLLELGDKATVTCKKNDLVCELEFTTKGFFSGEYNGIKGTIKQESTGQALYNISGKWSETMYISSAASKNAEKTVLFDANASTIVPKHVLPEEKQGEYESRRLWTKVTQNLLPPRNLDAATAEKSSIEDKQRAIRAERASKNQEFQPKHFVLVNDQWEYVHAKQVEEADKNTARKSIEQHIFP